MNTSISTTSAAAFNTRLTSLSPRFHRIARNAAGTLSEHTPEDVEQTIWVKLLERQDEMAGRPDIELLTFAKWRAQHVATGGRTYSKYVANETVYVDDDGDEIGSLELFADSSANPEDLVINTESLSEIEAAIEQMDPINRQITYMLYEGYTGQEIAAALKLSEGAISQRKSKIKNALALFS